MLKLPDEIHTALHERHSRRFVGTSTLQLMEECLPDRFGLVDAEKSRDPSGQNTGFFAFDISGHEDMPFMKGMRPWGQCRCGVNRQSHLRSTVRAVVRQPRDH